MNWLFELHKTQPIAHAVGVLAFVCVVGMALGSVKVKGIGLGTAGVLFAGILVGHFGKAVDHHTLDFVKEFGLILFVFTIGLQLGPGFLAALQQQGVKLNMLAAAIVLLGAAGAPLAGWLAGFDAAAVLGIFSGASTNTPSLGAGTQTLSTLPDIAPDRMTDPPALAFASNVANSDAPTVAYATVYPLTTLLRILSAQVLAIALFR
jgi:putative transport protein